jgi:hypothetical protein
MCFGAVELLRGSDREEEIITCLLVVDVTNRIKKAGGRKVQPAAS